MAVTADAESASGCARTVQLIRRIRKLLRPQRKQDQADFVRRMYATARNDGHLPHLIRAVLKTGRSHSAPAVVKPLLVDGEPDRVDRHDILDQLGQHFAEAERAESVQLSELATLGQGAPDSYAKQVEIQGMPNIYDLMVGFAALKPYRATGVTGIPADMCRGAPVHAARLHMPVVLKSFSRGQYPTAWRGGLSMAIPKPGKSPASLAGWRNIMLVEGASKAVGKALRANLLQAFERCAAQGTCGARKRRPLALPSHTVQGHFAYLQRQHLSGGAVFIDGVNAFYSTVRNFLFGELRPEDVDSWLLAVHPDEEVRTRLRLLLCEENIFDKCELEVCKSL